MEKLLHMQQALLRSRRLPLVVIAFTLIVLAATIAITTRQVRSRIREQIASRDGEVLHAVATMQMEQSAADLELTGDAADPWNQLAVVLETSRPRGVMGTRLFDAGGEFVAPFPPNVREARLNPRDVSELRALRPVSRFYPAVPPDTLFYPEGSQAVPGPARPVLEVNVPLHTTAEGPLLGIAQFLIEGHSLAGEFARLDRHLVYQSVIAFLAGSGLLAVSLGWAFRRLRQANLLLAERTATLLRANQELTLAAKTSALGAVTSHLIHGLKSPLAGLRHFVTRAESGNDEEAGSDRQHAMASTQRMQALIGQIVNVLREEETGTQYELTLAELVEIVTSRVRPLAQEAGVDFRSELQAETALDNRAANLVMLILVNLIQNAVQATPAAKIVTLAVTVSGDEVIFAVRDEGCGFPEALRANPFAPHPSAKAEGSGIGLAISKQLANHLGARLELADTSLAGCVFRLAMPMGAAAGKSGRA
jgi:signal transduction histidine kinase